MTTRAVIYARISSDPTGREAGVTRQLKECRELAARLGMTVVEELIDNDISATSGKTRPAFERMLTLAPTAIIAWHQDRLLRLTRDLDRVVAIDVPVHTVMSGTLDLATASGRAVARTLAVWSQHEGEHKAERQRAANRDRVSQGRTSTAPRQRPFGFEADGIAHRPAEAEAIREAYRAIVAGSSLGAIARRWNAAGFVTSRDNEWTSGGVALVLASPRYAGRVTYLRQDAGPANWEAVVDSATWTRARGILTVGTSGMPGRGRTLLGALALCGVCGGLVKGGSNNGRRSYRCDGPVQHLSRKAADVEDYVAAVVAARLARPDAASLFRAEGDAAGPLSEEAEEVRTRLDELAVDFADGSLTASQLRAATARLRARLSDLEGKIARVPRSIEFAPQGAWDDLDIDQRRRLVDAMMTVTLKPARRGVKTFDPATVGIEWKSAVSGNL